MKMMQKFKYYAFFDVDETIINMKTMFSFMQFYCKKESTFGFLTGNLNYYFFKTKLLMYKKMGKTREFLNSYYYLFYQGVAKSNLETLSNEWFEFISKNENLFNKPVLSELAIHKKNGAGIVFVSGSFFPCLDPLKTLFAVNHVISTNLECIDGILTGKIIPPQTIGNGKAKMITDFVRKSGIDLASCFAYGDHSSDIPMLELVGNPVAVGRDSVFIKQAKEKNWKVI